MKIIEDKKSESHSYYIENVLLYRKCIYIELNRNDLVYNRNELYASTVHMIEKLSRQIFEFFVYTTCKKN